MSSSGSDADQTPQAEPQEAPAEDGVQQPAETQGGFWQQPTEPMEREYQPVSRRSQENRE